MKVCIVVPGFSANDEDWCIPALRHLVSRLAHDDEVHVVALRYPYQSGRFDLFGARITTLGGGVRHGGRSVLLWQRTLRSLAEIHRRHHFDLFHAFWANETGALTAVAGRLIGVPTIVSLAGGELVGFRELGYGAQLASMERLKLWLALRLSGMVTAGSRYMMDLAAPWLSASRAGRLRRFSLGVDLEIFMPPEAPVVRDLHRLIHVASLSPVKDQATMLRAAALLRNRGYSFLLEIVGVGNLEPYLRGLAARLELDESILFRGSVPHDQMPAAYRAASLFVLSSRHEAQGMVVLEAAACGLPTVGTRVGVLPELAPDSALAVPVADSNALAEAIAELWTDPARASEMAISARRRVEQEFSLEKSVENLRELYSSLA